MRERADLNITGVRKGTALAVRIVPKATRTEIVGVMDDGTLKVRLIAPPVKGQADTELVRFLASVLHLDPADIEIVAGVEDRKKLVSIYNLTTEELNERLKAALD